MRILQLIRNCDFLGKTQPFTISKKTYFQTYIGSFFSFTIVGVLTYFIFNIGIAIIQHKKPHVITTIYQDADPSRLNLTKNNFVFTIGLQNPDYSLYVNESIYNITLYLVNVYRTGDGNTESKVKELPLVRCSEYSFQLISDYFELMDLANLYCLKSMDNLYLEGEFGQDSWTYFDFQFNKCVNSTENDNFCMPQEEIDKRLDGGYIGMFMNDLAIHPDDYSNPSHIFGKNIFSTFSAREYADIWLYLKKVEVHTDNGIILDSYKTQHFFGYESLQIYKDYRNSENFLSLRIRLSQKREVYDRSYDKIQTIAADLSGIMKLCLILGRVIVYYFREFLYCDFIMSFYKEKLPEKKLSKNNTKLIFPTPTKNLSINSLSSKLELNNPKTKNFSGSFGLRRGERGEKGTKRASIILYHSSKNLTHLEPVMMTMNKKISFDKKLIKKGVYHFTLSDFLGPCLVNSRIRNKLISRLNNFSEISFMFDIINYLKINNELIFIKKKIFDDYQNELLLYNYKFEQRTLIENYIFDYVINEKNCKIK